MAVRVINQLGQQAAEAMRAAVPDVEIIDAGADHVCIQALSIGNPFRPDERALEALAPDR